ncbi:MAG: DUF3185 domain-containing protein [Candidatus Eisenbacteria bacterium]|uniref:DUF3185 domain-containing protein n=1 Tax=Eiseniibacteriota bacterium TaxID=2212470 RepID=A0A538SNU3_UNCEI|nr:MAG: DUF3185 domain-containing protein [Candidatus Eisenbacteria bacterium]TMQ61771.1 MAG: DUF3185 domain-containing protein [Candidatus Eisenbacteria bacterium]
MKQLGILLVVLGIVALVYGVLGVDRQTAVIDVGGIKATATEHKTTPIATVLGIVSLVGGAALLVASKPRA